MNLPDDTNRLAIVGKTGSGKTVGALWHLSQQNFDEMPWIVIDYKIDDNINSIEGARQWSMENGVPKEPGIYIVHPLAEVDDDELEKFLWQIHKSGYVGVYVDEGYMIPNRSKAFLSLLTQGRSKHIPMIILSQRPRMISRFVFTESEFFMVYHLTDADDRKRVESFLPTQKLKVAPKYHSYYYDVSNDEFMILRPVPRPEVIIRDIEARLSAIEQPEEKKYRLKVI